MLKIVQQLLIVLIVLSYQVLHTVKFVTMGIK